MSTNLEVGLYVFVLATFLGFELIRRVPKLLHTPLMSLTNAISGIALVGSLVIAGAQETHLSTALGALAVTASSINVIGGFMITDRMLKMFHKRESRKAAPDAMPSNAPAQTKPASVGPATKYGATARQQVIFALEAVAFMAAGAVFVALLRWAASGNNTVLSTFTTLTYIAAAGSFILALRWLTDPKTARRGVQVGELGMLLAVVGTLVRAEVVSFEWIAVALFFGAAIGIPMALFMPMTAMPQRIALSHAFGALAAALVGTSEFYLHSPHITAFTMGALGLEVLLGLLTFTGSLMAFGKLQGVLPDRPVTYRGQNVVNISVLAVAVGIAVALTVNPGATWLFPVMSVLALAFGVMLIVPIGGADMPTVISLLNSYAGLSGAAMGFVLGNKVLIIAGALDGSSGFLLSIIMCRAMNRSFTNVLFGAFGQVQAAAGASAGEERSVRSATPDEAAELLDAARTVIVVPGYGMAVAQAQHKVRELADLLSKRGVDVRFAIHPVAGRMPGHMNVLLAEANVPYDQLFDMDQINDDFATTHVVLVIGANDVVNPAARHDQASPIYGMPILNVDQAASVLVVKRSMRPGFAGIENELFYLDKTQMVFGDAKAVVQELIDELSKLAAVA
jgi:proton-translocating NAD(P)+ transhydrogenase subunit beta